MEAWRELTAEASQNLAMVQLRASCGVVGLLLSFCHLKSLVRSAAHPNEERYPSSIKQPLEFFDTGSLVIAKRDSPKKVGFAGHMVKYLNDFVVLHLYGNLTDI